MKELVQNRDLTLRSYDLGDHCILIEGFLTDHRYRPSSNKDTEESWLVHDMIVRLKVRGPGMLIEGAEAEMPHHPKEECPVVIPWIRKIEGLSITSGFTMKVKEIIGNSKGCAHLTSLVIALGPAAVQGYWAAYGVGRKQMGLKDEVVRKIINTCYLWRQDGPMVGKLKKALKSQTESE